LKLVSELSMLLSCLLFHSLIYLCNYHSNFAYLLFASLGLFTFCFVYLFVCLFVSTLLLVYCRVHCVNLAIWLLYVDKPTYHY